MSKEKFMYGGDIEGFPVYVVARMLDLQEECGNKRDISVFEKKRSACKVKGGFDFKDSKEGYNFWFDVAVNKRFGIFLDKYPVKTEFKGEIKDLPVDIVEKMLEYQVYQCGIMSLNAFEEYACSNDSNSGFNWGKTIEGVEFWIKVIHLKDFDTFFSRYPKKHYFGYLKGFPIEIINAIVEKQVEQGNKTDACVFDNNISSGRPIGGFDWSRTREGHNFWRDVMAGRNFDLFFEKYPRVEKVQEVEKEEVSVDEAPKEVEKTFPRVMMVSLDGNNFKRRVVIAHKQGVYIAWNKAETLDSAELETVTTTWKYAKEFDPEVEALKEKITSEIKELQGKIDELNEKLKTL